LGYCGLAVLRLPPFNPLLIKEGIFHDSRQALAQVSAMEKKILRDNVLKQ
jgi:hypothetical protein